MISLADIIKAKEASSNGSGVNLENIYLALIKLEWSSADLANNLNNTNIVLSSSISSSTPVSSSSSGGDVNISDKNSNSGGGGVSEYAIVKDSGLFDSSSTSSHMSHRNYVDPKESIIMQTLKLLCQRPGASKANAAYQGPYSYIPGIMGSQEHFSSKYAAYAELSLIVLIFSIWIFSIWLCFYRYSRLRTLQPGQPRYNFDPMHINQVRIVQNERDGMIILKKKPSHCKGATKISSGYLNTTSSSKTSLLMHPFLSNNDSSCLQQPQKSPPTMMHHHGVEPLIVVDTVNDAVVVNRALAGRHLGISSGFSRDGAGDDDDNNEYYEQNSSPASHSRSFSEPHVITNYARLFHRSVPAYATTKLHTPNIGRTNKREYSQYSQVHQSRGHFERYHTINTSSIMTTTTNAALIAERQFFNHYHHHMSPQQHQQHPHEHRPRAARLTKQAPVQLNVTPPPPDRERDLSIKAMLHRVTDRRSMYAKSKLSFKRLLTHRVSQGDVAPTTPTTPSIALESLDIGNGSGESSTMARLTATTPIGNQSMTIPKVVSSVSSSARFITEKSQGEQETENQQLSNNNNHDNSNTIIDTNLLDPHRIPPTVRKSLLDMHYHLHQKPPLLQTSRISKSDSNIKVPPFLEKNKKMLSLQKSSYD